MLILKIPEHLKWKSCFQSVVKISILNEIQRATETVFLTGTEDRKYEKLCSAKLEYLFLNRKLNNNKMPHKFNPIYHFDWSLSPTLSPSPTL